MQTYTTFRYIDHTEVEVLNDVKNTAMTSFAIDDALTTAVSERTSPPILRLWLHPATVVLGIPDTRLPYIHDGVKWLKQNGYHVIVRNSGGLAVALDRGVLNMSLILPNIKKLSIEDGYNKMFHFIKRMLQDLTTNIKAYEIAGSYCPGDYDLSVEGVKFAGISQRRIRDATAIQIYLDVNGRSKERATLVRDFYKVSKKGEKTSFTYPTVNPDVLSSLQEILKQPITVTHVKQKAQKTLASLCKHIVHQPYLTTQEMKTFYKRYEQMIKRNRKLSLLNTSHR